MLREQGEPMSFEPKLFSKPRTAAVAVFVPRPISRHEPAPVVKPFTTLVRLAQRTALFRRRGFSEKRALASAKRLRKRDDELDDRRMCIECAHLQRDGVCFAARQGWIEGAAVYLTPVKAVLQRCGDFKLQEVRSC